MGTYLVTDAAGFIGSAIAMSLINDNVLLFYLYV
jgi:nucleoside-diphosphate-sugar epimerase